MSGILLVILSMLLAESCAQTQCSDGVGFHGIGQTRCVLLTPYYSEYQWATCLTDSYIRRASDQDHVCRGGAAICWYQCQLELNDAAEGAVEGNCRCSTANTSPTPDEEKPTLPPECLSPGGLDCSWYRECLEMRYPCEGTGDGYAIEYALKYCNLFSNNYNDFSPSGRLWVDGVRKCLQLVLVPLLRPFEVHTCANIKTLALNSHSDCYLNPASGAPSMCDIPCLDIWKVFWIVNGVGGAIFSEPVDTAKQMIDVMVGCYGNLDCTRVRLKTLILAVPGVRSTVSALRVGQFIARYFNFDNSGIGWFPYFDNSDIEDSSEDERHRRNVMPSGGDNVMLLLVDLQLLNISNGTATPTDTPGRQSLEETITALGDAVSNGVLSRIPVMLNETEVIFEVSSMGQCGDTLCSNSTNVINLATAPPPTVASTRGTTDASKSGTPLASTIVCALALLSSSIITAL